MKKSLAKRFLSLLLTCAIILSGCSGQTGTTGSDDNASVSVETAPAESSEATVDRTAEDPAEIPDFTGLDDPNLLQYTQDDIYAELEAMLPSEDYHIEDISMVYISKEYLEEVAFNSQSNVFFGYSLEELDAQFQGTRYVFTLSEDGETGVEEFSAYNSDAYKRVIRNVAIGSGVILICVTVSVATVGAAPVVSAVFTASAETAAGFALKGGVLGGVAAGIITGIQTGKMDDAIEAAAVAGSEGFKWGAVSGAVIGGVSKVASITGIPTWQESEERARKALGGDSQKSFLAGKEVPYSTPGSTRPDLIREIDGHLEAVEVKNFNLENTKNVKTLCNVLEEEVEARIANCPDGTTQRIVLDVKGRFFSQETIDFAVESIQNSLSEIYPNIPIDIIGGL